MGKKRIKICISDVETAGAMLCTARRGMACTVPTARARAARSGEGQTGALTLCPNCGGEVEVKEHTSATQCPYCDSYLIFNERVEGRYAPQMMIPFQMGKETCKQSLRDKFKKCLFAPTDFLSEARLNSMQGYYVPYWFYDYDTTCSFEGRGRRSKSGAAGTRSIRRPASMPSPARRSILPRRPLKARSSRCVMRLPFRCC